MRRRVLQPLPRDIATGLATVLVDEDCLRIDERDSPGGGLDLDAPLDVRRREPVIVGREHEVLAARECERPAVVPDETLFTSFRDVRMPRVLLGPAGDDSPASRRSTRCPEMTISEVLVGLGQSDLRARSMNPTPL